MMLNTLEFFKNDSMREYMYCDLWTCIKYTRPKDHEADLHWSQNMFIGPNFEIQNPADFKNCLELFCFQFIKQTLWPSNLGLMNWSKKRSVLSFKNLCPIPLFLNNKICSIKSDQRIILNNSWNLLD